MVRLDISLSLHFQACPKPATPYSQTLPASRAKFPRKVLANGFQKKTQKTPKQEIEKALKIKEEYEKEKE
jgi:hypothetical protein